MDSSYNELSEDQRVELWNLEAFTRMGFDGIQTANLLSWGTDSYDAKRLIDRGCDHALALLILQPDDAEIDEGTLVLIGNDGQVVTVEGT